MNRISRRLKRLLAILCVEIIAAANIFPAYAAAEQYEDGVIYEISEEEAANLMQASVEEEDEEGDSGEKDIPGAGADVSEGISGGGNLPGADANISSGTENGNPDGLPGEGSNQDESKEKEPGEAETPELTCSCDTKCTSDEYNANCLACSASIENCKGLESDKYIDLEIIPVEDNSNIVTVMGLCRAAGEEIEGYRNSWNINVNGLVIMKDEAPDIENYNFIGAVLENGAEVKALDIGEKVEKQIGENEEGQEVIIQTTTRFVRYMVNGEDDWTELTGDSPVVIVFEYEADPGNVKKNAVKFTASFIDRNGKPIEGYTSRALTFEDSLDLTLEPETINNYKYVEAEIDGVPVISINKGINEEDSRGTAVYSYTTIGGEEVIVDEDKDVSLIYEKKAAEVEITLAIVDEEGLSIEGYEETPLPEFETGLLLNDPKKAPVEVEGYTFKEASVDGTIITALLKEFEDEETEDAVPTYYYETEDGEKTTVEEDTVITLTYEEGDVVVLVDATIVDEFGDEIAEKYTGMDIEEIFGEADELVLNDLENPPVKNVSVRQKLYKLVKYTYVKATIDGEIIAGLKKAESKASADAEKKEFVYSYTTDGEEWTKIKEDTTILLEYTDGIKTVYTYEDGNVLVTATLQHANAIPDDAEFVVTWVTPSTSGYNYDAYMEALNANASLIDKDSKDKDSKEDEASKAFTEENTLLYDIAFLAPPVDEDGEAIEGDLVEYQPAEGMVSISFTFKQKQLEEDLNAEKAEDVTVIHMPLSDSAKESAATTADATGISASDINVEVVSDSTSVLGEQVDFCLSDFSLVAFWGADDNIFTPGGSMDALTALGAASAYGITANKFNKGSHADSNFAVKEIDASGDVTPGQYTGSNAGNYIIADIKGTLQISVNTASKKSDVYCSDAAYDKIDNQTGGGKYRKTGLKATVQGLINAASTYMGVMGNENTYDYKELIGNEGNPVVDLTKSPAGTYYLNGDELFDLNDVTYWINEDQNIVFNFTRSSISLKQFTLKIGKDAEGNAVKTYTSDLANADADAPLQHLIFNMPNATRVSMSVVFGAFLCPNADVTLGGTCTGWLVCDTLNNGSAEWHAVYQSMPAPSPEPEVKDSYIDYEFKVTKSFIGAWPEGDNAPTSYTFYLKPLDKAGGDPVGDNLADSNAPMPGNNNYMEISVQKDAPTASFGTVRFSVDAFNDTRARRSTGEYGYETIRGSIYEGLDYKCKYLCYMYEIGEVIPSDATNEVVIDGVTYKVKDGIYYTTQKQYVKIWHNVEKITKDGEGGFTLLNTFLDVNGGHSLEGACGGELGNIVFKNKYEVAQISGSKKWDDNGNKNGDRPSEITVNLLKVNGENEEIVASTTASEATNWKWRFTNLKKYDDNGNEIVYTVEEVPIDGYETSIVGSAATGFTITNTKKGSLEVRKQVAGNSGDLNKEFEFTVILYRKDGTPVTGTFVAEGARNSVTFDNGTATLKLKHNQSIKITGIPAGSAYTVIETEANQNGYETVGTNTSGTISATNTPSVAEFTNTKNLFGKLTISKTVVGPEQAKSKKFKFKITLTKDGQPVSGKFGDDTFDEKGQTTIELSDGESRTINMLSPGIHYVVEEEGKAGFTTVVNSVTGAAAAGDITATALEHTAAFTNTYNATGSTKIEGLKTIENRNFRASDHWTFTLKVDTEENAEAPMPEVTEVTLSPRVGSASIASFN